MYLFEEHCTFSECLAIVERTQKGVGFCHFNLMVTLF